VAPVRIGLLTTARINDAILDGAGRGDAAEVVAVGSRDLSRAEAYAREKGIARAHGSYEAVLGDPDVDAVYVALPNALHVEWATRALEAGKHVLVEKPFSTRPEEVEATFDLAEREGLVLMEAFMYRHQPQAKRLKALVEEGAIGQLRLVRAQFSFNLTRTVDVRLDPELGGGALLDVGAYCVNVSRLVAGEPEAVHGERVVGASGVDVRFAGVLRFPGDVLGHFDCGFDLPRRHEVEVAGSEGLLRLSPAFGDDRGVLELHRGDEVETVPLPETHRYQLEVENFAAAVRGDEPPLLGRADAVGQARALAALLAASR
jgi:D-xylose 1-dehydrogenase (NADP+, D-xylono-1,5-lactone-forming)